MNKRAAALILITTLYFVPITGVSAAPGAFGGAFQTTGDWTRLLGSNATFWGSPGDFFHYPIEEPAAIHALADHGFKIIYRIFWWWPFFDGDIATNTSVVDLFYNSTLLGLLEDYIDNDLSHLNMSKIWGLVISEEEPSGAFGYFDEAAYVRYNDTFYAETGIWINSTSLALDLNETETLVMREWKNQKLVSVYNHIYDYIKSQWPHLKVFQTIGLNPGPLPIWEEENDISSLKADAHLAGWYYPPLDVYDNPFWLYQNIRQFKSTFPNRYFQIVLWGLNPTSPYIDAGGYEHIRRNAWVASFAGVDVIGWFTWNEFLGDLWSRDDIEARKQFLYLDRVNYEITKVPVFEPKPKVLGIVGPFRSHPAPGIFSDIGVFNEWNCVNQLAITNDLVNLSQYEVVIANERRYLDGVIEKLNDYVNSGGNLILLGGFGDHYSRFANSSRVAKFLMEENGIGTEWLGGQGTLNVTKPNPLNLTLQYDAQLFTTFGITVTTLTPDHHPIGEFFSYYANGTPFSATGHPLVLYQNSSNSAVGWTLYWGVQGSESSYQPDYEDVVDTFVPEWNYTRFLWRNITRAFCNNLVKINGSVSTMETQNMLITQTLVDNETILAAVSNFNPFSKNINYSLDLAHFNLPDGQYYAYSLDENVSLGPFDSSESILEIPLDVDGIETRLLHISQNSTAPDYSVKVHPDIPTQEEAEQIWVEEPPVTTTTTTTPTTTPTGTTTAPSTPSTSTPLPPPDIFLPVLGISAMGSALVIVLVVIFRKKSRKK